MVLFIVCFFQIAHSFVFPFFLQFQNAGLQLLNQGELLLLRSLRILLHCLYTVRSMASSYAVLADTPPGSTSTLHDSPMAYNVLLIRLVRFAQLIHLHLLLLNRLPQRLDLFLCFHKLCPVIGHVLHLLEEGLALLKGLVQSYA